MNSVTLIGILTLLEISIEGRNLVPNPSFEEFRTQTCGISINPTQFASDNAFWVSPTKATPHIYSTTVPETCWNYVSSESRDRPRTGTRMVMICNYYYSGFRSYIQVELTSALRLGEDYKFVVWMKLTRRSECIAENVGFLLSEDKVASDSIVHLNLRPTGEFLLKSDFGYEWTKFETHLKADRSYRYLTIGNFRDNASTKLDVGSKDINECGSDVFIDDVELTLLDSNRR